MKLCHSAFNLIFIFIILFFSSGCKTNEEKEREKEASTLRFHLEENPGPANQITATVYRDHPVSLTVRQRPFLDEGHILRASVIELPGAGFMISILFDDHGRLVLDQMTTHYRSRHIAIFSQFGEARWLAAPKITRRISDGMFKFTPDATLEEAERIVNGLNNIARELHKDSIF